ncbi:MAG: redoxin domain-containing protein [Muribaculaceae bacterium]|nr:redoxin domain-containing protein [Muribaculaceae bacterium]
MMMRLINADTKEVIDSLPVINGLIEFPSDKYEPCYVRIDAGEGNGSRGSFVLSDADIVHSVDKKEIEGGAILRTWTTKGGYNDVINSLADKINPLITRYYEIDGEERAKIGSELTALLVDEITAHRNDPVGYVLFVICSSWISLDMMEDILEKHPALGEYNSVQEIITERRDKEATQAGRRFVDFSVTYDGKEHRLSDAVGHGDYVLLDFWASWCGPCRAEMPIIKEAFGKYADSNFKVIGVTVWDEPELSMKAADQLELPWEVWVNAGKEVSDAYNVTSVPLLILFGPDGTILELGISADQILSTLEKHIPSAD